MEELSAEKFRKFTDILFDVLGKNDVDVNRLIEAKEAVLRNTEEYKGRSEKELRAIAYSEVVAEMMEPVLTDTDAISRISQKIKQQDKSLWGKIKDFIKGIVEKLKAAYRDMEPDSAIARLTRETVTNSEAVLDAFSEAAADAVVNYNLQEGQKNNAREGERYSPRMTSDMTEQERYDKLKNLSLTVTALVNQNAIAEAEAMYGTDIRDGVRLKSNDRKKLFQKIASIFGITRDYRNQDVELEFGFSNENLSESLNKQKRYYYSYLKMLSCFENVVDSAIGIETHNRNEAGYKVDPTLENMYVLVSAFQDGENITPVKLEIKEFSDKPNTLYVAIALDSIQGDKIGSKKSGIATEGNTVSGVTQSAPPLTISLADLFANVNPQDSSFLKYVPTQFLTEQQRAGEKYSSRTATDSEYLNLAQNPEENREALSRMVEQAAKEAGYDSPMLYHGTQSFGFTNFDLDKMDDKRSIFLTSNPDIAATYSGVDGSRNIGKASGTDISTLSLQEVAQMMNQFPPESGMDYQYSVVESKAEISGQVDRGLNELNNLINTLKKQYGKDSKEYGRLEKLQNTLYLGTNDGLSTQLWMILKQTDLFKGHEDFVNGLEQNLRLLKKAPESGSFLVEKALGGYSIDVLSEADAKEELAQNMQRGNYALYARLGNTLTVEGEGQRWNNLKNWAKGMEVDENSTYVMEDDGKFFLLRKADDSVVENGVIEATEKARELSPDALQFLLIQKANTSLRILTEVATTTRDVTKWAKNAGYDSVIFKNIKDSGGQNNSVSMDTTADIYAIFNPNNAKSADAVTYDDNGNVIPLSQRFDMGKEDIRYSARYAAAEENPEIADLVQRVLSGDFKANDKVYLGTVPSQNAARIQEITGIDVDGFRVAIEARQIEHILNRHGIEGSADHSMAQVSDISKIQYTLDNPDSITPAGKTSAYVYMRNGKNRTADTVLYEKDIGGKSYYTVQAIADTKAKTLYVVSAFIGESGYKKGTPQFTNAKSLGATSETAAVDVPTGNVAQSGTNVKGENLESRRVSQEIKDAIEEYRRQQDVQSKAYRQMYERQMEEVKKSYQKQISTMESEYSADLAQIQDAFFQTVEAYEKGQFRNEHLEKALKQAMEAQRTQTKASEADNATWEKEFKRLLKAYEASGRNAQRLKQTVEAQRARAKAKVEAARVTEQRGKLYRAVNEINRRLLNPTKTLYVPDSLAPAVTKFMQGLTEAMESPKNSWNVQGALETLQGQYQKLTQMNEGVFTQEYNQGILDLLDNAINAVGGTDFNKLSAGQIEDVYSAVRSVLTAIRNENKMFAANLNKTYAEAAAAVLREESGLPNRKPTTGAVQDKAEKFGWNQLKPVYAMMRLGSDTLLKQYNNLRAGEDKWQRVIAAARAYGLGTMAKYNYDQWDDSLMKLDTETGTVELSLQERMSLYAYARREQAFEHLTKGGFVLSDKNTRTVKNRLGIETEQT